MLRELSPAGLLAYLAYDAVGVLAGVLCIPALPILLWRGYGAGAWERLGRLPAAALRLPSPPLWIHAASVGETLAVAPLVARLRRECPHIPIILSTTTLTGRSVAQTDLTPDVATLLPIDPFRIVDRAFRRLRPRCLVLVETELWPGLLRAARRVGCPVVVVSGRLSARALRRYRWAGPLFPAVVGQVAALGMQTELDAQHVVALGASAERVRVTGSLKASREPTVTAPPPLVGLEGRRVLIAASTQPGEEQFVLRACEGLWGTHPDLLLLIAPRRPERFDTVEEILRQTKLSYVRRTRLTNQIAGDVQVLLLDSVGELARFFPLARAVFVGGTIAPVGGHNVLEPATYGKAVAFGPSIENVADAARALREHGGAEIVGQPEELARFWGRLLTRREEAERVGARARSAATVNADAIEHTWAMLAVYLGVTR